MSNIRTILEKYVGSGFGCDLSQEDFDKLEIDLVEWERRSNQLAVQKFVRNQHIQKNTKQNV